MSWSSTGKAGVIVAPEESTNMENLVSRHQLFLDDRSVACLVSCISISYPF